MQKNIWIINYYTSSKASNPRYSEFAKYFRCEGYNVITFNSTVSEGIMKPKERFISGNYEGSLFVHVKTPTYVGNGLKRMLSIFVFAWRLFCGCKRFNRPDIILFNVHAPFDYPIVFLSKRLRVPYIAEVWDLWPEDFVTFGLINDRNPVMNIAYLLERRIYEQAERIIFTFEGGIDYLKKKKWLKSTGGKIFDEHIHYVNNGVNLKKFEHDKKMYPRNDDDLNDDYLYKIIYVGSVNLVNNVKLLIDGVALLQANPKYKLFIYGNGSERDGLEEYVQTKNIKNVVFKEKRIPFYEVAWIVSQATINVMNYMKDFGKYGVSSGKMFQYFAAGKPICCNIQLNYSDISKYNLGIDEELDTPEKYSEAIKMLCEQSAEDYNAMCDRVKECAKHYDYKYLSSKELSVIKEVIN